MPVVQPALAYSGTAADAIRRWSGPGYILRDSEVLRISCESEPAMITRVSSRVDVIYCSMTLFVFALLLRVIGLDWGQMSPDENPGGAAKVLTGEFSSSLSFYPPLLTYLTAILYVPYYGLGRMLGWWASTAEFRAAYFEDRMQFVLVGRVVVVALSAVAAPITFLLAVEQGVRLRIAFLLGGIVALLPASVYWAHIAKSDSALGPAFLFVLLAGFCFCVDPGRLSRRIALALSIAVAVSFKQSAVFFLAPTLLIFFFTTALRQSSLSLVILAWAWTALTTILFWIPLNIGIILNLRNFMDAQVTQTQMSLRDNGLFASLAAWFDTQTSDQSGIPPLVLLVWVFVPLISIMFLKTTGSIYRLLAMWTCGFVAMAIIVKLAGTRETGQLLLPYSVLMTSTVLLLAGHFIDGPSTIARVGGSVALLLIAGFFAAGTLSVTRQALAQPVARDVSAALSRLAPPGTRLLSDIDLTHYLPVSSIGATEMHMRDDRLAAKYSIILPSPAAESKKESRNGYVVRSFPFVMGGMENTSPDAKVLLPYVWPLQTEEWRLDYWLARDYRLFVFQNNMLNHSVDTYRNFFTSIDRRCARANTIETKKPMFEGTELIYQCR